MIDLHHFHMLKYLAAILIACLLRQLIGNSELHLPLGMALTLPHLLSVSSLAVIVRFHEITIARLLVVCHVEDRSFIRDCCRRVNVECKLIENALNSNTIIESDLGKINDRN